MTTKQINALARRIAKGLYTGLDGTHGSRLELHRGGFRIGRLLELDVYEWTAMTLRKSLEKK